MGKASIGREIQREQQRKTAIIGQSLESKERDGKVDLRR